MEINFFAKQLAFIQILVIAIFCAFPLHAEPGKGKGNPQNDVCIKNAGGTCYLLCNEYCSVDDCNDPANFDSDHCQSIRTEFLYSCGFDPDCVALDSEGDFDGDGLLNDSDNCAYTYNPDQTDSDQDGIGDVCDNCSVIINSSQSDIDIDTFGNHCDNCPLDTNYEQEDTDGDGFGDACDICQGADDSIDNDGDQVPDGCDLCEGDDLSGDTDQDGVCDDSDVCLGDDNSGDSDNDGSCDDIDNCPTESNQDQLDSDEDGIGDACDICQGADDSIDNDGDQVPDGCDLCEGDDFSGDTDQDGVCDDSDVCLGDDNSGDSDNDGSCDDIDNCPTESNQDQLDSDEDGIGDACDATVCGDGDLDPGEACDDGNLLNGDGCDDVCQHEPEDVPVVYLDKNPVYALRGACYPALPYLTGCAIFDLYGEDPSGSEVTLSLTFVATINGLSLFEVDSADNILRQITGPTTLTTNRLRIEMTPTATFTTLKVIATNSSGKASDELEVLVEYAKPPAAPIRLGDDVPTEFNEDEAYSVYKIPVVDDDGDCISIVATSLPATGFVERIEVLGQPGELPLLAEVTEDDPKICTCCTEETLNVRYNNVVGQNTEVTLGYQATDQLYQSSPVYEHLWIVKPLPNQPELTSTNFFTDEDTPLNFKLEFFDLDQLYCGPPCDETWQPVSYTIEDLPPASEGVLSIDGVAAGIGTFVSDVETQLEWAPAPDFNGDSQFAVAAANPFPGTSTGYNFLITTRSVPDTPSIPWENPNPSPVDQDIMCVPYSDGLATVAPPIGLSVDDADDGPWTLTLGYSVDPNDDGLGGFCFVDAQTGLCTSVITTPWSKTDTLAELNALLNSLAIIMGEGSSGFPRIDTLTVVASDSTGLETSRVMGFRASNGDDGGFSCPAN
jgi:hypothetical protein